MELWDLYNGDRESLNRTVVRGEKMVHGEEYHVVVCIFTITADNKLLLTLRDANKEKYPNKWEVTAGSVIAGEESIDGAKRELFEETGISVSKDELTLIKSIKEKTAFIDIYLVHKDVREDDIVFQDGETMDAKLVSFDEFEAMMNSDLVCAPVERRYKLIKSLLK